MSAMWFVYAFFPIADRLLGYLEPCADLGLSQLCASPESTQSGAEFLSWGPIEGLCNGRALHVHVGGFSTVLLIRAVDPSERCRELRRRVFSCIAPRAGTVGLLRLVHLAIVGRLFASKLTPWTLRPYSVDGLGRVFGLPQTATNPEGANMHLLGLFGTSYPTA